MNRKLFFVIPFVGLALGLGLMSTAPVAMQKVEKEMLLNTEGLEDAIFAGGCFWCVEAGFEKADGVYDAVSGYTAGHSDDPSYREVAGGRTGHTEAVQVYYDPAIISYDDLLEVYWRQFDPTDGGGSFADRGSQYRSGIYYKTEAEKAAALASIKKHETSERYSQAFEVELEPASVFYVAEESHQDYYKKNPVRYKYYRYGSGRDRYLQKTWGDELDYVVKGPTTDESDMADKADMTGESAMNDEVVKVYSKPSDEELRTKLTSLQYKVTQQEGTEPPFDNAYNDNKQPGIYVDIVSGEPLFSSTDKYDSGTGWPSFTRPIDERHVATKRDFILFYPRTEVLSAGAGSHLGHVFKDGPEPTGLRYCMNSAAMRFVPKEELVGQGYPQYVKLFEE